MLYTSLLKYCHHLVFVHGGGPGLLVVIFREIGGGRGLCDGFCPHGLEFVLKGSWFEDTFATSRTQVTNGCSREDVEIFHGEADTGGASVPEHGDEHGSKRVVVFFEGFTGNRFQVGKGRGLGGLFRSSSGGGWFESSRRPGVGAVAAVGTATLRVFVVVGCQLGEGCIVDPKPEVWVIATICIWGRWLEEFLEALNQLERVEREDVVEGQVGVDSHVAHDVENVSLVCV